MDLTQSTDGETGTVPPPRNNDFLFTQASYEVRESGYSKATPVVTLEGRDSDGGLVSFDVEGFRPYFGIPLTEFQSDPAGVCNDRRVLTIRCDCSPELWRDSLNAGVPSDAVGEDIAEHLSDKYQCDVEHDLCSPTNITDDNVAEIYVRKPGHVAGSSGMRDLFEETYEADIPFTRRFLIDTEIYQGFRTTREGDTLRWENCQTEYTATSPKKEVEPSSDIPDTSPRTLIYDIEVCTDGDGFPRPDQARHPITAITAYDSHTEEYALFGLAHEDWDRDNVDITVELAEALTQQEGTYPTPITDDGNPNLMQYRMYDDETNMLEAFHDWVLSREFDAITGWNAVGRDSFDTAYLIQRSYNVQAQQIREYVDGDAKPGVWIDEHGGNETVSYSMPGWIQLDLLDAFKKTLFRARDSNTLDAVANDVLGWGKTDLASDELNDAWRDDPVDFLRYNVRDTQATVEIESQAAGENGGLFDLFENLRSVTGAPYEVAVNNGPMIDTLFLRRATENCLMLPTNVEPDESLFHGAKVFNTVPGLHEMVVYPDLSSMYPSLMAMLNLGTETIIGDASDLEESEYTEDDCYTFPVDNRDFAHVPKGESTNSVDQDEYKGVKTPDGDARTMFDAQYDWLYVVKPEVRESFITSTVDDLIDLKNDYEGQLYSAVKTVTNSCFTPDTEVLTPDGIKNIRDVAVGDMVYSLNPDTDELETQPVTEVIEKPDYDGELVNIQNRRMDFSVTPDHRVYSNRTRHTDEWESPEAGELNQHTQYELPHDWTRADDGERLETVSLLDYLNPESVNVLVTPTAHGRTFATEVPCVVTRESNGRGYLISGDDYVTHRAEIGEHIEGTPKIHTGSNRKWIPETYDGDDFIELCMWYVTEGSTYTTEEKEYENTTRGETTTVNIAQYDQDSGHYDSISALLDRMGLTYYANDQNHSVASRALGRVLTEICETTSHHKTLPSFIWEVTSEQKENAFQTLLAGDGDERDGSYRYTTSSDQLRDDMVRLSFETGRNARYSKDSGSWRIWYSPGSNNFRMDREGSTSTAEDGVYCVQVANNHMLVAGRNGKFQHIPNCYGVIGDSDSAGGKGFRLYDRRVAEGITMAGRMTITHTAETFTDYLQTNFDDDAMLVGGDTDSSVSEIPNAPDYQTALNWAHKAIEFTDESYDEFVQTNFGFDESDEHRLAVELENLSSKLLFIEDETDTSYDVGKDGMLVKTSQEMGVKKRYAEVEVWDDDDGWMDTDYDGLDADPLTDELDLSELKHKSELTYEDFESEGVLGMSGEPADHLSVSGFEMVRSDSAPITREAQKSVLTDAVLSEDPLDEIESYLQTLISKIKNEEMSARKLGRPKGINNALQEYGWKDLGELSEEDRTEQAEAFGGHYRQTPGPTYRGAKYADDHFPWEDLGEGSNPIRLYIENVRSDEYPSAYVYESYPKGSYPEPPETGDVVDAISVDRPERLPDGFKVDTEKTINKAVRGPLEAIVTTLGREWDDLIADGRQTGLGSFA